jgi:hypothetical protein
MKKGKRRVMKERSLFLDSKTLRDFVLVNGMSIHDEPLLEMTVKTGKC